MQTFHPPAAQRRRTLLLTVALFLTILGSRLCLIHHYGSDVPFGDQWDGEATDVYQPYFGGKLSLGTWFKPHNEHRPVFGRLVSFGLLQLNGQWDPKLQTVAGAFLAACIGAGVFLFCLRAVARKARGLWFAMVALLWSLPFGWENLLWGFQTSFYCLLGFSVLAIGLLVNSRPWSWKWIGGCVAAACTLFTMASGFLIGAVVVAVLALGVLRNCDDRREMTMPMPTIAVCLLLTLAGLLLKAPVEGHRVLHAHSVNEFVAALTRNLAWPNYHLPFLCLLSWLPFAGFVWYYTHRKIGDGSVERFVLGLGCWVLLQAAATAFSRGAVEREISSRYMDILAQGVSVNALAVLLFAFSGDAQSRGSSILRHAFVLNFIVTVIGLATLTTLDFKHNLPGRKAQYDAQGANLAAFVATDNPAHLRGKQFPAMIPFPDPEFLITVLRDPAIRRILPTSLHESRKVGTFSVLARTLADQGIWFLTAGLLTFGYFTLANLLRMSGERDN